MVSGLLTLRLRADAVRAGEAAAVVVEVDVAVEQAHALVDVDAQVGRADGLARTDLRGHRRGRQVVDEKQRLLEAGLGDDVAGLEVRVEDAGEQPLGEARGGPALQLDVPDAAFDDRDLHRAVADRLLRQVGLREEVAARAVIGAHLGGGVVQTLEVELLADEFPHHLGELLVGEERVAREGELRDLDLQRRAKPAARAWAPGGRGRTSSSGRRRQAQRLALAARGSVRRRDAAGRSPPRRKTTARRRRSAWRCARAHAPSLKRRTLISLTPGFLVRACVTRARQVRPRDTAFLDALRGEKDLLNASGRDRRTSACGKPPAPLTPSHLFFPNSAGYRLFWSSTSWGGLPRQNIVIYCADQ